MAISSIAELSNKTEQMGRYYRRRRRREYPRTDTRDELLDAYEQLGDRFRARIADLEARNQKLRTVAKGLVLKLQRLGELGETRARLVEDGPADAETDREREEVMRIRV